jgi:hypothetical protein
LPDWSFHWLIATPSVVVDVPASALYHAARPVIDDG